MPCLYIFLFLFFVYDQIFTSLLYFFYWNLMQCLKIEFLDLVKVSDERRKTSLSYALLGSFPSILSYALLGSFPWLSTDNETSCLPRAAYKFYK